MQCIEVYYFGICEKDIKNVGKLSSSKNWTSKELTSQDLLLSKYFKLTKKINFVDHSTVQYKHNLAISVHISFLILMTGKK